MPNSGRRREGAGLGRNPQQHRRAIKSPRLVFSGAGLWDATDYAPTASRQGSSLASATARYSAGVEVWATGLGGRYVGDDVGALADLLADGRIIGVVRGRSEFGPRALGHRSLLADPSRPEIKERMNALKHREWWRPVAPMVAHEDMVRIFEEQVWSPYMSFAPRLQPRLNMALPAIAHFDGTARVQTVAADQDPWLHALLRAVAHRTGFAVLCNTSLNTRGKPILNRLSDALALILDQKELDFLFVDGWLLDRRDIVRRHERGMGEAKLQNNV